MAELAGRRGESPNELGTSSVRRWHDIVQSALVSLDFVSHDADRFSAGLWKERVGQLGIVGFRGTELTAQRSSSQTRDPAGETTILIIQLAGSGVAEQSGREGPIGPGSIVFLDLAEPYTVHCRTHLRRTALELAQAHCADPALEPEALARALHVSRRTLYRLFEAERLTLADHIVEMRLTMAADTLREGDRALTINDVAAMSGFRSMSIFHAQFLRRYGVTPGEFRAAHDREPGGTLPE